MSKIITKNILLIIMIIMLYQNNNLLNIFTVMICGFVGILSYKKNIMSISQNVINQISDKMIFVLLLITLVDLEFLNSAVVAWVLGCMFIMSGFDLLKQSLKIVGADIIGYEKRNFAQLITSILIVISFCINNIISHFYQNILKIAVSAWLISFMGYFMFKYFQSKEVNQLLKEA